MHSFASTAIYLASSLTAGPIPAPTPAAIVPTVMIVPVVDDIETRTADSRVEANPFAAARARGGKSLSEAIADVVRRDALEDSSVDAGTGISLDPKRQSQNDGSLSEDITAAHDARIGFIKQRMDELRVDGASAGPLLEQLNAKLHLAMSARCLAVAREASEHLLRLSGSNASSACLPDRLVVATNAAPVRSKPGYDRPRPSSAHQTAVDTAVASARPLPSHATETATGRRLGRSVAHVRGGPAHRVATEAPASVSALVSAAAIHPAGGGTRHPGNVSRSGASDRARRLLALARHLLEDGHQPNPDIRLTGLMHWKGSETWSLAEYGQSA